MADETEGVRRVLQAVINADQSPRAELEAKYGPCWDTQELQRDFEVLDFMAPFVMVRRRSDGMKGTCLFCHAPRTYYSFEPAPPHLQ